MVTVLRLVLADEFHLMDFVGMQPTTHVGVGHEAGVEVNSNRTPQLRIPLLLRPRQKKSAAGL